MKKLILFCLFYFSLLVPNKVFVQTISEDSLFIIEKISVDGNRKTKKNVIIENFRHLPGDTLTENEINSGIERVRGLQFFKKVTLQPRAGSVPGKLHLTIKVQERYLPSLRFRGGFSELDGWYLTPVSLNLDNILGWGNFTDLNLTIGDRVSSLNFNYINPNIFDSDLDFYFRYILRGSEFLNYVENQKFIQNVSQVGLFLGFRSRTGFFKRFLFGLNYYISNPDSFYTNPGSKETSYDLPEKIRRYSNEQQETSAFSIYYDLDKRDQAWYPQHGWWLGLWFTNAGVKMEDKTKFTRLILDIRKYQNLTHHLVIAARVKLGGISAQAPFYEKFYLGGPNSLRGYKDRSLSPVGGGERLLQGGLELRFPLTSKNFPRHFLSGVIFFESGANLLENETVELNRFKSSYGFGFRFKLPFIGLFRIDFAYPVEGKDGLVQVSLGHTF